MSEEWKHASWVSGLGKWAWIIVIINGLIGIISNIVIIAQSAAFLAIWGLPPIISAWSIWEIIGSIIVILIGFVIIRPKFSKKCAAKDWDGLYDWALNLGSSRIPWMLLWGIIIEIFSWYFWGGLVVLIPAIFIIFAGPKPYDWKAKK